ncbi:stage II sporulation protein M [Natranaerobius trueperi]|uniref:Stage II sporulation protein M n=1 Tax=Natranaerobius trueperi TaxID=759412 RepID=A0A226C1A4_9FIRM|nr:stage II sporulation protein M [Natranaerobius trueperi]OWZ84955.1 hypothetical protein CDO51_00690 [Natranaerobius trueperi]
MTMIDSFIRNLKPFKLWLKLSTLIFFGSALVFGVFSFLFPDVIINAFHGYFGEIEQMGDKIFGTNPFYGTAVLFWNNFTAVLVMIFMGIILALPTFFALLVNGGALGVLASILTLQGENPLVFYGLGILPHGIFEVPAILIAGGLGLKIGYQILFPPEGINRGSNLKNNIKAGIKILPGIIIMLAVAAVIEIFITPFMLGLVAEI